MFNKMTDVKLLLNTQGPKLIPFLVSVIVYFVFVRDPHGELWTTILKCAPIICLMLYTAPQGLSWTKKHRYSQLILLGLIFSCGGDALLNWDLFPQGMGSFACAQVCYIFAFGYKPLKWSVALPLYMAGAAFVFAVFKHLDDVLAIGLPIYVTLLTTMCWCSVARAVENKSFLNTLRAIGSVSFVISDGFIGVDMFLIKVPNARIWIMFTYYLAQFAISFSQANVGTSNKPLKYFKEHNNSAH